jgi:hypothetical protein
MRYSRAMRLVRSGTVALRDISVATQQLRRFWIEADMSRPHLNGSPKVGLSRNAIPCLSFIARSMRSR